MRPSTLFGTLAALLLLPAVSFAQGSPAGVCASGSCHAGVSSAALVHQPLREGKCTACHLPAPGFTAADHSASSFRADHTPSASCLACHPDTTQRLSLAFTHVPAAEEGCAACHAPHGSDSPFLLVAPYPRETLMVYKAGKYGLCWDCHEEMLASEKFTSSATSFRMGERNFHYSHLHKRRGGMSCRACHDPHGTPQERLVRREGPSGDAAWKSRMTFLRDAAGGRCVGGCHKDIRYRR